MKELYNRLKEKSNEYKSEFNNGQQTLIDNQLDCLLLKEFGFNEPTNHIYKKNKLLTQSAKLDWNNCWDDAICSCPTYEQAVCWLFLQLQIKYPDYIPGSFKIKDYQIV